LELAVEQKKAWTVSTAVSNLPSYWPSESPMFI
jgi:hypothetical protein